ncbi:hypothetical protein L6164_036887 [Bauhinia variegata]|uniref:Uncharacterized protein n=1 Tax=Bauhinia variegata TaxID=167791 RepID=A0ACB9KIK4_BAUVA|nr:hypothetical protein L6164_036887 [Bauhinia variegata]
MEITTEKNISLSDTATKGETVLPTTKVGLMKGPPGSGKSTQCSKFAAEFGFSHLSFGDLLQAEIQSASQHGTMIEEYKKEGKLVPSEIVATVLEKAMKKSKTNKFLVDGFPRNQENLAKAENIVCLSFFLSFLL